ncbi:MAG TPA: FHA domain-containing protein [Planctomycetota bacterium]|nr:FHA domain-containing protein [Planctomycetota bacterium]
MMKLQHTRPDGEVDTYHLKPGRKYHLGRGSMCEVRILDLKLSRKHCVIEHGLRGWQIEDLASTNGCRLDGQQIIGSAPLKVGIVITMGQSTLNVASLVETDEGNDDSAVTNALPDAAAVAAKRETDSAFARHATPGPAQRTPLPDSWTEPDKTPAEHKTPSETRRSDPAFGRHVTPEPAQRTPLPDSWSDPAKASEKTTPAMRTPSPAPIQEEMPAEESGTHAKRPTVELDASDWHPEPADAHVHSGPLPAIAVTPRPVAPAIADEAAHAPRDEVATPPVASEPPRPRGPTPIKPVTIRVGLDPVPAANAAEAGVASIALTPAGGTPIVADDARTFSITVLGRRLGPLTRAEARDLKARELKGTLSEADLEPFPKL